MQNHGGDWAAYLDEYGKMPLDFSASISPLGLPESVRKAAAESLDAVWRYPDPECRRLRSRLSERFGIPAGRIVCGNGAADLIDRICRGLRPGRALLTAPTFSEYERALLAADCGVSRVFLREENGFRLETEEFLDQLTEEIDLVFLCNPANPTGLLTERDALVRILRRCREKRARLVLDECFMEFAAEKENCSMAGELESWPELIVLRAFTKSFAMAGLRLGYALCGQETDAGLLRETGQPWPVSHPAQEAGIAALEECGYLRTLRSLISRERERVRQEMLEMGLRVIPGRANFLLFFCGDSALAERLRAKEILIRDCGHEPGLIPGWFRAAIRTETENDLLLGALREVL